MHALCVGCNGVFRYLCMFALYTFVVAGKTQVVYVCVVDNDYIHRRERTWM